MSGERFQRKTSRRTRASASPSGSRAPASASRRDAERMIAEGRVKLNGRRLDHARRHWSTEADRIEVDGAAARRARAHPPLALPQAEGARHHQSRSGGPRDDLLRLPRRHAARRDYRPARHQYRGPAAPHQRRRACARPRAPRDRLAAPLPRARAWRDRPADARQAAPRRHHRRHGLWRGRGEARPRAGLEPLADGRLARGQEPRGEARARASRARREPPDPRLLRPVPARRPRGPARSRRCGAACSATSSARSSRRRRAPISRRRLRPREPEVGTATKAKKERHPTARTRPPAHRPPHARRRRPA